MKLSVIIPMYNVEKYISTTLYSLINQNNKNFEVILVDDGSTDNTYNTAKSILSKGELIDYKFIKQKNSGVSSARNRGLVESTGDYVLFLDGDDYVSAELVQTVSEFSNKEADVICWGYNQVKFDNTTILNYFDRYNPNFYMIDGIEALKKIIIEEALHIWTGSAIYKKDFLLRHKLIFTDGCSSGEDIEFIHKALFNSSTVLFLNKTLSFYVRREGSITNTYNIKRFDAMNAIKRTYQYINSTSNAKMILIADEFLKKYLIGNYFYNLHSCFYCSNKKDIKKILLDIDKNYPGLNSEIRKLLLKYNCNDKKLLLKSKLFLFSPSVYFFIMDIRKKLSDIKN